MLMKKLLTYVSPKKGFYEETKVTVKIQIDNSLDLGWKREGVQARNVSDKNFTPFFFLHGKNEMGL